MRNRRRGNTLIETALFIPILLTLLVSVEQLGKLTYTYYSLKNTLYAAARYVGTQQAVNFCDASDPNVTAALNFAVTGTSDGSAPPLITGLTPAMLSIAVEQYDPAGQTLGVCDCSSASCSAPDFIAISIPDGFSFTPNIPFSPVVPILLKPQVLVPYGGT